MSNVVPASFGCCWTPLGVSRLYDLSVNLHFDASIFKRPRWIVLTILGVLVAVGFSYLGMWQLDRLAQRQERNATIASRSDEPARPLADLRREFSDDPEELAFRHAYTEGTYRPEDEFVSIGRVSGSTTGTLVATPLVLDDGSVLIVVRGIVPVEPDGSPVGGFEVTAPDVLVSGRLTPGEAPLRIGEPDPPTGHLEALSRLDLEFIDQWVEGDVLPFMLLLDEQTPAPQTPPVVIPDEELTEGKHLGYAVQWFAFSAIALVGLVGLLYRAGSDQTSQT